MKQKRHSEHNCLQFTIVHKDVSNVSYHSGYKKWNESHKKFRWEIIRPDNGERTVKRFCEFCGKELWIEVDSFARIAFKRKLAKKVAVISGIIEIISLLACIFLFSRAELGPGLPRLAAVISEFTVAFALLAFVGSAAQIFGKNPGYSYSSFVLGGDTTGHYDGHFVEIVESHSVERKNGETING